MTLLLLLLGCGTAVTVHCESTDRTLLDGEQMDFGGSVSDVLANIGPASVEAIDLAGAAVLIDVSIARDEGAAQLADGELIEEITRRGGRNIRGERIRRITWEGDPTLCDDVMAVPVEITVVSEDGAVSVVGPGTLTNLGHPEDPSFQADYTLSEADVLPAGLHGARTGGQLRIMWHRGAIVEVRGDVEALVLKQEGPPCVSRTGLPTPEAVASRSP